MKILVAIQSSENPKTLSQTTLRWAARAGFNMRVFIPDDSQLDEYREAIDDANHNWYLDLPETVIVAKTTPEEFAKKEGFDLIVYLPDNLRKWNPKLTHDENVLVYAGAVGRARSMFSVSHDMKNYRFDNGAEMRRI